MTFDEIFAPGMRHWREQKDFEADDSHHATAEGNPFEDMLDEGIVVIRDARGPRAPEGSATEDPAAAPESPEGG